MARPSNSSRRPSKKYFIVLHSNDFPNRLGRLKKTYFEVRFS
jgi:hypothetical protein